MIDHYHSCAIHHLCDPDARRTFMKSTNRLTWLLNHESSKRAVRRRCDMSIDKKAVELLITPADIWRKSNRRKPEKTKLKKVKRHYFKPPLVESMGRKISCVLSLDESSLCCIERWCSLFLWFACNSLFKKKDQPSERREESRRSCHFVAIFLIRTHTTQHNLNATTASSHHHHNNIIISANEQQQSRH